MKSRWGVFLRREVQPTVLILLAVFAFRSTVAEPYSVPTGSMEPTILPGDRLFVNKMAYAVKFPFTGWKLWDVASPSRGDVIVFRFPRDPSIDYVKRLIGLPGDVIEINDGKISLNGKPLELEGPVPSPQGADSRGEFFKEALGPVIHYVQRLPHYPGDEIQKITVPDDHFFFMGDNRDNSNDGRFWGFVPREYLKGKALRVWLSFDSRGPGILPEPRWYRTGEKL